MLLAAREIQYLNNGIAPTSTTFKRHYFHMVVFVSLSQSVFSRKCVYFYNENSVNEPFEPNRIKHKIYQEQQQQQPGSFAFTKWRKWLHCCIYQLTITIIIITFRTIIYFSFLSPIRPLADCDQIVSGRVLHVLFHVVVLEFNNEGGFCCSLFFSSTPIERTHARTYNLMFRHKQCNAMQCSVFVCARIVVLLQVLECVISMRQQ